MKSNKDNLNVILLFFSILISGVLFFINDNSSLSLLPMLPLIYGVLHLSVIKIYRYITNPGMFVLFCISVIRYLIIPILIVLDPSYYDEYGTLAEGIQFMLYEEVCIGLLLMYVTRKYYKDREKSLTKPYIPTDNYLVFKIIVISSLLVVIVNPSVLQQYNFFFVSSNNLELVKGRWIVTGIAAMIVDWGKLFLPIILGLKLIKKYNEDNKSGYYYLTILIFMFFNVMIFSGTSRNSLVMPAVASMFFLMNVFPERGKKLFYSFGVIIALVIFRLTFLKVDYVGASDMTSLMSIIDYLEAYFLGPKQMGVAISAKEIYSSSFTIDTVINDIMGNFPGLSHFFDLENRTTTLYNLVYHYGGVSRDAIIPSSGQGLFYFGYIFSFIPQALIILGMAKADEMYRKSRDIVSLYFYSYFAVRLGFTHIQSISITFSFIYSMILPIIFYIQINKLFNTRRGIVNEKNKNLICDQ